MEENKRNKDERNELSNDEKSARRSANNSDQTQGMSYSPNDASGVRSGGTADMDNQTSGGAGVGNAVRKGMGSNLRTKKSVSGSDYDGQNTTS